MDNQIAKQCLNMMVKIRPHDGRRDWLKGKLIAVQRDRGVVKLIHGSEATFPLDDIKLWTGANAGLVRPSAVAEEPAMPPFPSPPPQPKKEPMPMTQKPPAPSMSTPDAAAIIREASQCLQEIAEADKLVKEALAMRDAAKARWPEVKAHLDAVMGLPQ